jgi:hypothetical protein
MAKENDRYEISMLNGNYVVVDSESPTLVIVNSIGTPADNLVQPEYFGMVKWRAEQMVENLERVRGNR